MKKLSPRELRRLQSKMLQGLDLKNYGIANEVIINFNDKKIIIKSPSITSLKLEGEQVFQIIGGETSEEKTETPLEEKEEVVLEIKEDDIILVAQQANVSMEEAKKALQETNGDLAKAILLLKSRK
jgi:nascent polypeptide-associated complex subunit alpha